MSFTSRARAVLTLAAIGLALGLLFRQEPLALLGLTVVIWVGLEWANFRLRILASDEPFANCRRTVGQQSRNSLVLVADQDAPVQVKLHVSNKLAGLRCWLEDVIPQGCQITRGSATLVVDLRGNDALSWEYTVRPGVTRRTTLPGLEVSLSDPQGLFRAQRFVPLRQDLTVLPFMVRPQATVSVLKQQNVQLLPGLHRHRKPGYSTELLGIRDYQPGDPPRSIAWKATARLDRLMTCEYESEAPVRGTLLADLSRAQFLGRPGPARADRIVAASASIARLLLADGDPVACMVASHGEPNWLPHGLGERHLSRLLIRLLSFSEPMSIEAAEISTITHLAWTCGFRRFPELFDDVVNFASVSAFTVGRRRQSVRQRKQLSLALAQLYEGEAHLAMRLQFDDRLYRAYCRRLLEDHPGTVDLAPLQEPAVADPKDEAKTVETLCRGLLAGVARAHDNELFALVGTTPREPVSLNKLTDAVRVARAQHHRVLMVDVLEPATTPTFADPVAREVLAGMRQDSDAERFADLERRLTRLGAKIARMSDPRLMETVAAEVELLRSGRARTMRGRR